MASKLKILSDCDCDIFVDLTFVGKANVGKMLALDIRKGKYIIEAKVPSLTNEGDYVYSESIDYIMSSNDEEDIIKFNIIREITLEDFYSLNRINDIYRENPHHIYYEYINCQFVFKNAYKQVDKKVYVLNNTTDLQFDLLLKREKEEYVSDDDDNYNTRTITTEYKIPNLSLKCSGQKVVYDRMWLAENMPLSLMIYSNEQAYIIDFTDNYEKKSERKFPFLGYFYARTENLYLVTLNNKFGICSIKSGELLCPIEYEEIYREGEAYDETIKEFFESIDCTFFAKKNGFLGEIDSSGNEVVECSFDAIYASDYGDIVEKNGKFAIYKPESKNALEWYDDIFTYVLSNYSGRKKKIHGNWSYKIDNSPMICGASFLCYKKDGKIGYWDYEHNLVPAKFDEISSERLYGCSANALVPTTIGEKHGYIDKFGQELFPAIYDSINIYTNDDTTSIIADLFLYKRTGKRTAYLDKWIDFLIENEYITSDYSIDDLLREGLNNSFAIVQKNGNFGVLGFNQEVYIPILCDTCRRYYDKTFIISINGIYYYTNLGFQKLYNKEFNSEVEVEDYIKSQNPYY